MPKVTIAKIEGRARGGGSEIALAMDMCFAAVGKAIFGQPEVAVGLVPGGGSTQRLPRLIGRGRALEVLLGCNDLSAELAERYGYINRALPADELTPFVDKLAHRIASFPAHAIAHAKAAVDIGAFGSMAEGLLVEAHESDLSVASEVTQARVTEALKVGAETYEGELEMDFLSRALPDKITARLQIAIRRSSGLDYLPKFQPRAGEPSAQQHGQVAKQLTVRPIGLRCIEHSILDACALQPSGPHWDRG